MKKETAVSNEVMIKFPHFSVKGQAAFYCQEILCIQKEKLCITSL